MVGQPANISAELERMLSFHPRQIVQQLDHLALLVRRVQAASSLQSDNLHIWNRGNRGYIGNPRDPYLVKQRRRVHVRTQRIPDRVEPPAKLVDQLGTESVVVRQ